MQRRVKGEEERYCVSFIQRMAQQNPKISYELSISLTNENVSICIPPSRARPQPSAMDECKAKHDAAILGGPPHCAEEGGPRRLSVFEALLVTRPRRTDECEGPADPTNHGRRRSRRRMRVVDEEGTTRRTISDVSDIIDADDSARVPASEMDARAGRQKSRKQIKWRMSPVTHVDHSAGRIGAGVGRGLRVQRPRRH